MAKHQLFIQTALKQSMLALFRDYQCLQEHSMVLDHRSDNTYVNDIQIMLKKNKISHTEIHELYLVHGPCFFTGVRAGVIIAKAWYQLFQPKMQLVSSFDYISACISGAVLPYGVVIAGSGKEGYFKLFSDSEEQSACMINYEEAMDLQRNYPIYSDLLPLCEKWGFIHVQPRAVLPLKSKQACSLNEIFPVYIRREDDLFG